MVVLNVAAQADPVPAAHLRQDRLTIHAKGRIRLEAADGAAGTSVVNFHEIFNGADFVWGAGGFKSAHRDGATGPGGQTPDTNNPPNAVPEPAKWLLVLVAAAAAGCLARDDRNDGDTARKSPGGRPRVSGAARRW